MTPQSPAPPRTPFAPAPPLLPAARRVLAYREVIASALCGWGITPERVKLALDELGAAVGGVEDREP